MQKRRLFWAERRELANSVTRYRHASKTEAASNQIDSCQNSHLTTVLKIETGDLSPKFPPFKRRVLGSNGCLLLWSLQAKVGHAPAWLWPRIQRGWLRLGSYGV